MAKLRELLGENYKEGMTLAEAEKALEGKNLVDLSTGDYVSKAKYHDDTRLLGEYKAQLDGKQSEIDAAVAAAVAEAVEKAKADAKTEYEKQLETERTADKRKRAKEKHYDGLTDEQKGVYDAYLKDDDLTLSEDEESYSNFDELAKPIRERFKTIFPVDDGSHGKAGVDPANGGKSRSVDFSEYEDYKKLR